MLRESRQSCCLSETLSVVESGLGFWATILATKKLVEFVKALQKQHVSLGMVGIVKLRYRVPWMMLFVHSLHAKCFHAEAGRKVP